MSIFEPIIHAGMVEAAARETIQEWIETYVAEAERQTGRRTRSLPLPRSYETVPEFTKWTEKQIPAVILISPGLAGPPVKKGDGTLSAQWDLRVGAIVSARDQSAANELAKIYGAVLRTLILQRSSLGGFATGVELVGEEYDPVPAAERRTRAGCEIPFIVQVPAIANARGGPVSVPDDPYAIPEPWPPVTKTVIETDREAIVS